ncbi:hypothetical protein DFQ15_12812 [Xylophilus ampelinus]|uniref:Uncharacterized protein n=1 Tax=Xylophilus ampelinus TaxID=54067 RepID=A0A318SD98_9BURK|nr:hypothetical protein DFQ15_12812 [Xylophilus ampelinus]
MHFDVPAKAGERPGGEAQDAPRYGYRKRTATRWPGLCPAFPKGGFRKQALAALRPLPSHEPRAAARGTHADTSLGSEKEPALCRTPARATVVRGSRAHATPTYTAGETPVQNWYRLCIRAGPPALQFF